jgi:mono/diheme cytochrome c family protein
MSRIVRPLKTWLLIGAAVAASAALFVYFGVFNIAADVPHWSLVSAGMGLVRDRSIAMRSKDVQVPASLDDPELAAGGAEHYAAMCAGCHSAPGARPSELRDGLYPSPPDLTASGGTAAAEQFWIIKHGIKMSAMPAWGKSHDDATIWGIVAFLRKLPTLTPDEYRALTHSAENEYPHDATEKDVHGNASHHHDN